MADVQEIKIPIRENDALSRAPPLCGAVHQFFAF
jgi:hypothetical protein